MAGHQPETTMKIFMVEHCYPYTGEGPDELCICASQERAVKEIKKYIRRNEYHGAGVKMPKKKWKKYNATSWHWKEGHHEQYITIREEAVLE